MAMFYPSVGSVTVMTMQGRVSPPGDTVEEITRRGVDGHAYVKIGKRGALSTLVTLLDVSGSSGVSTHVNAAAALRGTFVTVTDPCANTFANVLVLDVEFIGSKFIATPVGGVSAGNVLVTLRWTVQQQAS